MKGLILFFLLINSQRMFAQTISLGNDTAICASQTCIILKASISNPSAGTPNYTVDSIPYQSFPYQGNNIVPFSMTYNGLTGARFSDSIALPFDFCFFNQSYHNIIVFAGGVISFNAFYADSLVNYSWPYNAPMIPVPASSAPLKNTIFSPMFFAYDSLNSTLGGCPKITWQVHGTAPNRAMVISWKNSVMGGNCWSGLAVSTFQVVLHEGSNKIGNNILYKEDCNGLPPIYGNMAWYGQEIIDHTGTVGVSVSGRAYPSNWGAQNESWVYTPTTHPIEWYDANNNLLATGVDSLQVCPNTGTQKYYVKTLLELCGGGTIWVSDTINVTKNQYTNTVYNQSVCNAYFFNNQLLTTTGIYEDTVFNASGCDSIVTLNLTILPNIPVYQTFNITTCNSYYFNNQLLTSNGIYHDTLITQIGCDSIVTLNLTINANNAVSQNGTQLTALASGSTYQWLLCNPYTPIALATNQTYNVVFNGSYAVAQTHPNGCTDTSSCITITSVGINELNTNNSKRIIIYPNPATNQLFIESKEAKNFTIYSSIGEAIYQTSQKEKSSQIDISNFSKGIYFIRINNETMSFIKQ